MKDNIQDTLIKARRDKNFIDQSRYQFDAQKRKYPKRPAGNLGIDIVNPGSKPQHT
jgi:hypothetical protein